MLLVASETGHVYTFATKKLQPMITSEAGKALIQTCLNSPDDPDWEGVRLSFSSFETGNEREKKVCSSRSAKLLKGSVVDPDPYVFGPPESGSISTRYGSGSGSESGSGSFYNQAKIVRKTLIPTVL
jgi:hypothetical protein